MALYTDAQVVSVLLVCYSFLVRLWLLSACLFLQVKFSIFRFLSTHYGKFAPRRWLKPQPIMFREKNVFVTTSRRIRIRLANRPTGRPAVQELFAYRVNALLLILNSCNTTFIRRGSRRRGVNTRSEHTRSLVM